jgi:hypothetical protein
VLRAADLEKLNAAVQRIATDRIPQPVPAVRNPHDDYTIAALRQKETLARQWGSD